MRWFRRRPRVLAPEQVEYADPMLRAVITECWNTGQTVVGKCYEDGSWEITPIGPPDEASHTDRGQ